MSLEVDIKKSFGDFTLSVRFKAENETLGFLGASGSGKSMTLKCIAGIETPDEGVILADGVPLFASDKKINLPPQKRRTGYLFQNAALFPNMTVGENLRCVIKGAGQSAAKQARSLDILRLMGLDGFHDRYPSQLSGGQQQRAALARILLSEPRILLLDEPFSALDSYLRWQLEQELAAILAKFGGTAVFVSHNRDEAYRLCSKIAVIAGGSIVSHGDKWEIFSNPQTYDACLLTGCKNISPARSDASGNLYAEEWDLSLYTDRTHDDIRYAGIRAHDISLTDKPGRNTFEYEVVSTLRDTFSYILLVRPGSAETTKPLRLELSRDKYEALTGLPKYIHIPPEKILLLNR